MVPHTTHSFKGLLHSFNKEARTGYEWDYGQGTGLASPPHVTDDESRRHRHILRKVTPLGLCSLVGNCYPTCVSPLTGVESTVLEKHYAFLQGVHFHLRHSAKVNQELGKSGEAKGVSRKRPLYTSPNKLFSVYFLFPVRP